MVKLGTKISDKYVGKLSKNHDKIAENCVKLSENQFILKTVYNLTPDILGEGRMAG